MSSHPTQHQHLYNTKRWQRLRRYQRQIEPLCRFCKERGIVTPGAVVDHVIPHNGDVNLFYTGELQTLCADCHDRIKRMEELHGFRPDVGLDGWPLDPKHPANRSRPSLALVPKD
jgi:5-methylcytosine-specific restriction endonuclease McrA